MKTIQIINKIDSGEIDTDELKSDFNETLYAKGYDFQTVTSFTDEHFENLLTFAENEQNFIKWINNN
jgi:hypothetical protein